MHNILSNIIEQKKKDILLRKQDYFRLAFGAKRMVVIGELKIASPTNPYVGSAETILIKAEEYEKAGAGAISVITEKHFFNGDTFFIPQVKRIVQLPILQKDFVIDMSQIYEAKGLGADAILLIARIVDEKTLGKFVLIAQELGIEPVVEIANTNDLKKTIRTKTNFIAVNARDLDTFEVNVDNACRLMKKIPKRFMRLGFSGVKGREEIEKYKNAGARGVLIGTSLMKARNIKKFILELKD